MVVHRYLRTCYANLGLKYTDGYIDLLDKIMHRFLIHTYRLSPERMLSFISDNLHTKIPQKILHQIMMDAETPFNQKSIEKWLTNHKVKDTAIKAKYYSYVFLYIFERMTVKLRNCQLTEKNLVKKIWQSTTFSWLLP